MRRPETSIDRFIAFFRYHVKSYFDIDFYYLLQMPTFMYWQKLLTIECQVAKNGSQEVHNKHGEKGDIWNHLHLFLWSTKNKNKGIKKIKNHVTEFKHQC